MNRYCEFSFALPIDQLLDKQDKVFGRELLAICEIIDVKIDMKLLKTRYDSYDMRNTGHNIRGTGDVLVFYSNKSSEIFITIDLYLGYTDQHDMVGLGISCPLQNSSEIKKLLIKLYDKGIPHSDFIESVGDELKNRIKENNFPNIIFDYGNKHYYQQIKYYVDGILQSSST